MFQKIKNKISWKTCLILALVLLLSATLYFVTGKLCTDENTIPPVTQVVRTLCEEDGVNTYFYSDVSMGNIPVFGSKLLRKQIKTVTFVDTLADAGKNAWDVSAAKDHSVLAWTKKNGDMYDLFIGAEGGVKAPDNCSNLFSGYINVTKIVFEGSFDTSSVTDMSDMFDRCKSLEQLDLSCFDTSSVTDMSSMFYYCESLEQLDLSCFDTSSVTDMSAMFYCCYSLEQLDLSGFDTSSVTDMSHMFYYCESLEQLDRTAAAQAARTLREDGRVGYNNVPPGWIPVFGSELLRYQIKTITFVDTLVDAGENAWDVSAAKDHSVLAWTKKNGGMYDLYIGAEGSVKAPDNCSKLFSGYINVTKIVFEGSFDTSSVTDMSSMFYYCESLEQLDLSCFDTSSVTDMSAMFYCCYSLEQLDLSGFDTSSVTDMSDMFDRCKSLEQLDLSGFDTSSVTNMCEMFYGCKALTQLDLSGFDTSSVKATSRMFSACEKLDLIGLGFSVKGLSKESFQLPENWKYRFPEPQLGSFGGYTVDAGVVDMEDGEWFGFEDRLYASKGHCTSWCGCSGFESQVEASSTLAPQGNVSYDACHLAEETRNSVWSEGVEGDGIGETISIKQAYESSGDDDELTFTSICIVNGYAQDKEKWQRNGRVKSLKLYYAGEYMGLIELKDTMKPQYVDVTSAQMKIGNGFTAEFSFEIAEVYKGTKYADTCLTGILIEFDRRDGH